MHRFRTNSTPDPHSSWSKVPPAVWNRFLSYVRNSFSQRSRIWTKRCNAPGRLVRTSRIFPTDNTTLLSGSLYTVSEILHWLTEIEFGYHNVVIGIPTRHEQEYVTWQPNISESNIIRWFCRVIQSKCDHFDLAVSEPL